MYSSAPENEILSENLNVKKKKMMHRHHNNSILKKPFETIIEYPGKRAGFIPVPWRNHFKDERPEVCHQDCGRSMNAGSMCKEIDRKSEKKTNDWQ
jgi:hypothetical protein